MRRPLILVAAFIAVVSPAAFAYEPMALTSDGHLIRAHESDNRAPWNADRLRYERGDYPYLARIERRRGKGWFRLELRPDGSVATVKVMQSTDSADLDHSAILAFSRWRFKPGKWKWVDEYMDFSARQDLYGPRLY